MNPENNRTLPESYLEIRNYASKFKEVSSTISNYWTEEVRSMDYLFNGTPEIINRLRDHCHWISGVRSYEYKNHHLHDKQRFEIKLNQLKNVSNGLNPVSEPRQMGGFGFEIQDSLINVDTLKYYESMIALKKSKVLDRLLGLDRPRIVEIGAGWGGFATALKSFLPKCQYVVVDLPETLIFSGTYLGQLFPSNSRKYIEESTLNPNEDLVFCNHSVKELLRFEKIDLVINMVSFQEMTSEQIQDYALWIKSLNADFLYSHNRPKSKHNDELDSVTKNLTLLGEFQEIQVLPVDYTIIDGSFYNSKIENVETKKVQIKENKLNSFFNKFMISQARKIYTFINRMLRFFDLEIKLKKLFGNSASNNSYRHHLYNLNNHYLNNMEID